MDAEQHLKLRQIKVFLEAAKHENFGAAGRSLGVSTTYISDAIAALERDLGEGVILFDRSRAGTRLSDSGRAFMEKAEALLRAEAAARRAVTTAETQDGVLSIAYETDFARIATASVAALLAKNEGLRIEATEVEAGAVARRINNGDATIGLGLLASEPPEGLDQTFIHGETFCLLAGGFYVFQNAKLNVYPAPPYLSLADLRNEPFAFPWFEGHTPPEVFALRRDVEEYFRAHGFAPHDVVFRSNRPTAIEQLVGAGRAVTVCDRFSQYTRRSADANAWPLRPHSPERRLGILHPKGQEPSPVASAFVNALRECLHETPKVHVLDREALKKKLEERKDRTKKKGAGRPREDSQEEEDEAR